MKKKFWFLFFLICFIPKSVFALKTVDATTNFYVNDYANILSSDTEKYIMEHSVALNDKTTAQIVVVTVPSLDGNSLEEYATTLFRKFGIGDSKKNNGLLLLLALEERQMRVEVGYGLESILPDGKTGRFQDTYMIPYFKEDNFDEGMLNGYKAFFKEVANYYEYDGEIDDAIEEDTSDDMVALIISTIIQIGFWVLFIYLLTRNNRGGRGGVYFGSSSFGSSSFGGSSSSSFSGGEGSSGGGGSSRGF